MREWRSKIAEAFRRRRGLEDDLGEELRAHRELLIDDLIAQGVAPDQARATARKRFGSDLATRESAVEAWQFPRLETILQDMRYGLRGIRKAPAFSLILVATLALGIGANTAIFSVVFSVLLRPLPYPAGERLVWLGESTGKATGISVTWLNYQHWRKENHSFENMAAYVTSDLTLTGRGEAVPTHAGVVTSSFFGLTGWKPLFGRLFTEEDDRPGATPTVLLTPEFWARQFGSDPAILGATLALNGKAYQVIGVLRPGLKFFGRADLYLPLGLSARPASRSEHGSLRLLGLLKPGLALSTATADLDSIMRSLARSDPGPEDNHTAFMEYLSDSTTANIRQTLWVLMGAVGLVLLIACANVASLLLVRNTVRAREIAIRSAIGAGRVRLARQFLTENLMIAGVGGLAGLGLAKLCLRVVTVMGPANIPRLSEAGLDVHVLLFGAALTLLVGLLAGVGPVYAAGKVDLTGALKEGSAAAGTGGRGSALRGALVIAEIAIMLVLSFGSLLLLRSLITVQNAYPGFEARNLLALELQLPSSSYQTKEAQRQFFKTVIEEIRRQPRVESVGAVNCPPAWGDCGDWFYSIPDQPTPAQNDVPISLVNVSDPAYFGTMRMKLLAGRVMDETDHEAAPQVAVVNETFARRWWSDPKLAVGHPIKSGGPYRPGPTYRIVGVVANVSQMGLDSDPLPEIYLPFSQRASQAMVVMIRTKDDPAGLIADVRRQVASIDREVPVQSLRPFETWLGASLDRRRFSTLLLSLFAALAIVLAGVGIYGVLNYWVNVRQKEIAVRMALGAQRGAILQWSAAHALQLALCGATLGAFGSWAAARWLEDLVYGIPAHNPAMLFASAIGVIAIAMLAAGLPLWRATRVDTIRQLRDI